KRVVSVGAPGRASSPARRLWRASASTKAAFSILRKSEPGLAGVAGCCACAGVGRTLGAVVAAAAPPTTAPLRKSRRPKPLSVMIASLISIFLLSLNCFKHAPFLSLRQGYSVAVSNLCDALSVAKKADRVEEGLRRILPERVEDARERSSTAQSTLPL